MIVRSSNHPSNRRHRRSSVTVLGSANRNAVKKQLLERRDARSLSAAAPAKSGSQSPSNDASDAVETYFERVGRVPLLTREGEVLLAKRIEDGERGALKAIVN